MDGSKTTVKTELAAQKHRFTLEQYHRMGEAGVPDEIHVELIVRK